MIDFSEDREGWPPGPWDDEPDRVPWTDPATGYPCIVRRSPLGAWCGYVGIPPTHPLHGTAYDEGDYELVDVHGGLTYGEGCDGDTATGICHVPAPGEPDDVWWFGFDCNHAGDLAPGMLSMRFVPFPGDQYRTFDYVTAEVTRLAAQLQRLDGR